MDGRIPAMQKPQPLSRVRPQQDYGYNQMMGNPMMMDMSMGMMAMGAGRGLPAPGLVHPRPAFMGPTDPRQLRQQQQSNFNNPYSMNVRPVIRPFVPETEQFCNICNRSFLGALYDVHLNSDMHLAKMKSMEMAQQQILEVQLKAKAEMEAKKRGFSEDGPVGENQKGLARYEQRQLAKRKAEEKEEEEEKEEQTTKVGSEGSERAKMAAQKYAKFKCQQCDYGGYTLALLEAHQDLKGHYPIRRQPAATNFAFDSQNYSNLPTAETYRSADQRNQPPSLFAANAGSYYFNQNNGQISTAAGGVNNRQMSGDSFAEGGMPSQADRKAIMHMLSSVGLNVNIPSGISNDDLLNTLRQSLESQEEQKSYKKQSLHFESREQLPMAISPLSDAGQKDDIQIIGGTGKFSPIKGQQKPIKEAVNADGSRNFDTIIRFSCQLCHMETDQPVLLFMHLGSEQHKNQVSSVPVEVSEQALTIRCILCQMTLPYSEDVYDRHLSGKAHEYFIELAKRGLYPGERTPQEKQLVEEQIFKFGLGSNITCGPCGMPLKGPIELIQHQATHAHWQRLAEVFIDDSNVPRLRYCQFCNFLTESVSELGEHKNKAHQNAEEEVDRAILSVDEIDRKGMERDYSTRDYSMMEALAGQQKSVTKRKEKEERSGALDHHMTAIERDAKMAANMTSVDDEAANSNSSDNVDDKIDELLQMLGSAGGRELSEAVESGLLAQLLELKRQKRHSEERMQAILGKMKQDAESTNVPKGQKVRERGEKSNSQMMDLLKQLSGDNRPSFTDNNDNNNNNGSGSGSGRSQKGTSQKSGEQSDWMDYIVAGMNNSQKQSRMQNEMRQSTAVVQKELGEEKERQDYMETLVRKYWRAKRPGPDRGDINEGLVDKQSKKEDGDFGPPVDVELTTFSFKAKTALPKVQLNSVEKSPERFCISLGTGPTRLRELRDIASKVYGKTNKDNIPKAVQSPVKPNLGCMLIKDIDGILYHRAKVIAEHEDGSLSLQLVDEGAEMITLPKSHRKQVRSLPDNSGKLASCPQLAIPCRLAAFTPNEQWDANPGVLETFKLLVNTSQKCEFIDRAMDGTYEVSLRMESGKALADYLIEQDLGYRPISGNRKLDPRMVALQQQQTGLVQYPQPLMGYGNQSMMMGYGGPGPRMMTPPYGGPGMPFGNMARPRMMRPGPSFW